MVIAVGRIFEGKEDIVVVSGGCSGFDGGAV
jgi:hypothetical protein